MNESELPNLREMAREHLIKYWKTYERKEKEDLKLCVGDNVYYYDSSPGKFKMKTRWNRKGVKIKVGFGSYQIKLDDGRLVTANRRHVFKI